MGKPQPQMGEWPLQGRPWTREGTGTPSDSRVGSPGCCPARRVHLLIDPQRSQSRTSQGTHFLLPECLCFTPFTARVSECSVCLCEAGARVPLPSAHLLSRLPAPGFLTLCSPGALSPGCSPPRLHSFPTPPLCSGLRPRGLTFLLHLHFPHLPPHTRLLFSLDAAPPHPGQHAVLRACCYLPLLCAVGSGRAGPCSGLEQCRTAGVQ